NTSVRSVSAAVCQCRPPRPVLVSAVSPQPPDAVQTAAPTPMHSETGSPTIAGVGVSVGGVSVTVLVLVSVALGSTVSVAVLLGITVGSGVLVAVLVEVAVAVDVFVAVLVLLGITTTSCMPIAGLPSNCIAIAPLS